MIFNALNLCTCRPCPWKHICTDNFKNEDVFEKINEKFKWQSKATILNDVRKMSWHLQMQSYQDDIKSALNRLKIYERMKWHVSRTQRNELPILWSIAKLFLYVIYYIYHVIVVLTDCIESVHYLRMHGCLYTIESAALWVWEAFLSSMSLFSI